MSAIYGFIANGGTGEELEQVARLMWRNLSFRGDPAGCVFAAERVCLGGCRLPHERLECGYSGDDCAVALEGEIYNLQQLRRELELPDSSREGLVIRTLYRRHGLDFPRKLNGIFAIALYDGIQRKLLFARDHVGGRSLYYTLNRNGLFFASTIKALIGTRLVEPRLSLSGISSYFASTAISPPDTMYAGISALRPGTVLHLDAHGEMREHTYWNIREIQEDRGRSLQSFSEELRELLVDAIRIRGESGGHYGSIVSGGLDTSAITGVLARGYGSNAALPAFSIVFDEVPYSDAGLQQAMYRAFPLQPNSAVITARQYWDMLQRGIAHLDSPVNDDAMVGMYRVFQMARERGCAAIFDGEAADELFFTGHAHAERRFQKYLAVPYLVRKLLLGQLFRHNAIGGGIGRKILRQLFRLGLCDTERRLLVLPSFYRMGRPILRKRVDPAGHDPLATARGYLTETRLQDPLNIYHYGLLKNFLPDVLLYKNERMAAANRVTNRTPFIDHRLVELALRMPEKFKVRAPGKTDDGTKIVYKKALEGMVPEQILRRKKTRGFSIPSSEWYRQQLRPQVRDLLFSPDALHREFLDQHQVSEVYAMHDREVAGSGMLLNAILVFELWLRDQVSFGCGAGSARLA